MFAFLRLRSKQIKIIFFLFSFFAYGENPNSELLTLKDFFDRQIPTWFFNSENPHLNAKMDYVNEIIDGYINEKNPLHFRRVSTKDIPLVDWKSFFIRLHERRCSEKTWFNFCTLHLARMIAKYGVDSECLTLVDSSPDFPELAIKNLRWFEKERDIKVSRLNIENLKISLGDWGVFDRENPEYNHKMKSFRSVPNKIFSDEDRFYFFELDVLVHQFSLKVDADLDCLSDPHQPNDCDFSVSSPNKQPHRIRDLHVILKPHSEKHFLKLKLKGRVPLFLKKINPDNASKELVFVNFIDQLQNIEMDYSVHLSVDDFSFEVKESESEDLEYVDRYVSKYIADFLNLLLNSHQVREMIDINLKDASKISFEYESSVFRKHQKMVYMALEKGFKFFSQKEKNQVEGSSAGVKDNHKIEDLMAIIEKRLSSLIQDTYSKCDIGCLLHDSHIKNDVVQPIKDYLEKYDFISYNNSIDEKKEAILRRSSLSSDRSEIERVEEVYKKAYEAYEMLIKSIKSFFDKHPFINKNSAVHNGLEELKKFFTESHKFLQDPEFQGLSKKDSIRLLAERIMNLQKPLFLQLQEGHFSSIEKRLKVEGKKLTSDVLGNQVYPLFIKAIGLKDGAENKSEQPLFHEDNPPTWIDLFHFSSDLNFSSPAFLEDLNEDLKKIFHGNVFSLGGSWWLSKNIFILMAKKFWFWTTSFWSKSSDEKAKSEREKKDPFKDFIDNPTKYLEIRASKMIPKWHDIAYDFEFKEPLYVEEKEKEEGMDDVLFSGCIHLKNVFLKGKNTLSHIFTMFIFGTQSFDLSWDFSLKSKMDNNQNAENPNTSKTFYLEIQPVLGFRGNWMPSLMKQILKGLKKEFDLSKIKERIDFTDIENVKNEDNVDTGRIRVAFKMKLTPN